MASSDLRKASLQQTNLGLADLHDANLEDTNLQEAALVRSGLPGTNLRRSNLTGSNLSGAWLFGANLETAVLRSAALFGTHFFGSNLRGVDFSEARFQTTCFSLCDLSGVLGLETAIHMGPSCIDFSTVEMSFRGAEGHLTTSLRQFFESAGLSPAILDALVRAYASPTYKSCFISYGDPDSAFARRLYDDLKARGVPCWLYALDSTVGEGTWSEIRRVRNELTKMVVLCSAASLVRSGVLKELDEQIDDDPTKLMPISLDNVWTQPGFQVLKDGRDLKPYLTHQNWADFANLPYEEALDRLLLGLRQE
jgi:hypothetical protein